MSPSHRVPHFLSLLRPVCMAVICSLAPIWGAEPMTVPTGTASTTVVAASTPDPQMQNVENSVVKIFATLRQPDLYKPWSKQAPQEISATGIVIENKRILTNAHVVLYASQVQVQANQSGDKLAATVEFIAPNMDLAVLKLDDESFFETHSPLPRANALPDIKNAVLAYGFPTGGNSLSITKGIISRIEFAHYNNGISGLRIQIDAAINPGNSGGPAMSNDKMVGLAYSHLGNAQNIGYIIPCEEIELFLKDVEDGNYDGKPSAFDELQTLENPALRAFLKLDKSVQGIVVHRPFDESADYPLKEWDVITKIGDVPVDDQGMIKLSDSLRVRFAYLIQKTTKAGKVALTVVRSGKEMHVEVPVTNQRPFLIPDLVGTYPSYFICGPVVFSTATAPFVNGLNASAAAFGALGSSLITRRADKPKFPGEQLVVISSPLFPHKLSKGYSNPFLRVVTEINGKQVKSLTGAVEILRDSKDEFVVISLEGLAGESLVFPRKEMIAATEEILTDNGIRSQGTADTLSVWNKKL